MFYEQLEVASGAAWIDALSNYFTSDQDMETYKWLGQVPAMREWLDGKNIKGLRVNAYEIINREFEATLGIKIKDLRRDKTGQIRMRIGELVKRSESHWASLLSTLMINGESSVCYDGQYYFDTDHVEGDSGTQKNLLTSADYDELNVNTAAKPTATELVGVIMVMIQHLLSLKDDQGEPRNEDATEFLAMVPINMWASSVTAMSNANLASGSTQVDNVLLKQDQFSIKVVPNVRLTGSGWANTQLALFRADAASKPFIRQEEEKPHPEILGEDSDHAFHEKEILISLEATRNVGYGMWSQACKATLS